MPRFILLVRSNPVEGREADYNDWYDQVHLREVLTVPGFVAAERFELEGDGSHRYLAIYEIEAASGAAALAQLKARSPQMDIPDALDRAGVNLTLFRSLGARAGSPAASA